MAFANKIGNFLKKSVTSSPLFQAARWMSSLKAFVGGLLYGIDDHSLREIFTSFGEVVEVRVIMDRDTRQSNWVRFVIFTSSEQASAAISGMDGKDIHSRMIRVNYATDRTGGFRGGSSGYRGSYGSGGYGGRGGASGGGYGDYGSVIPEVD
ncbi:glycine-rich RNA-binding protein 3, mitochondrial-like [Zingiber officinale]|uniref:glycine-rich RNA-binding protein 3, mitochondrial-like n=1 Tax=Zingiber officinale TaxID=94328 RepID=UPI001C4A8E4E|nr:glycine-rich RNA-binding protein 3, mitochondrial-like [Zingiber officinale]